MSAHERITVLGAVEDQDTPWTPVLGEEARAAVERAGLDDRSRQDVLRASAEILSQSWNPSAGPGSRTGLVVGYVQSGKTLSFTTVAALANDNGFRIVIVIAGTTTDLAQQSHERLLRDLDLNEPFRPWEVFFEPNQTDVGRIRDVLEEAQDDDVPIEERPTLLITLKKNHFHLRALIRIFSELGTTCHLPALIIDDEADHASLNTLVSDGDLSSTYRTLQQLRDLLPRHTFLQYTATPQAPILINLMDVLSPDFAVLLNPGPEYVGGQDIFTDGSNYLEDIPQSDISTADHPLTEPPTSLLHAMRLFFIGVASGELRREPRPKNRSMMVHPSRKKSSHQDYYRWVLAVRDLWMETLSLAPNDPDRQELLEYFQEAHEDLSSTVTDLEPFSDIASRLRRAIRKTNVRLVNSSKEANRDIQWRQNYAWILVGGQKLDRGFTVEGLTVTYMPRGPGVGNADAIQQRARFLGYKRFYMGYCRVFLEDRITRLYRAYVRHEKDMHTRLIRHIESGKPMSEFRRVFLLDSALRPTRSSVLDIDYARPRFPSGWCVPDRQENVDLAFNRRLITEFVKHHSSAFEPDDGHAKRLPYHLHRVARAIPLDVVYRDLLTLLRVDIEDSGDWTGALMLIEQYAVDQKGAMCTVYEMRPNVETRRSVRDGRIVQLFQGAYPVDERHIYPGDRELRRAPVTVQLHTLTLRTGDGAAQTVVAKNVRFAAIWMAPEVRDDIIIQPQGGS